MEIKDMVPQFSDSPLRYLYEPCPVALKPTSTDTEKARIDITIYKIEDSAYVFDESLSNYVSIEFPPDSTNRFQEIDLSQVVQQLVADRINVITSISDFASKKIFSPMELFKFTLVSVDGLDISEPYRYELIYGTRPQIISRYKGRDSYGDFVTDPFSIFGSEPLVIKDEINISSSISIDGDDKYMLSNLNITQEVPSDGVEAVAGVLYFRTILGTVVQFPIDYYTTKTSHSFSGDLGSNQFEASKTPKEIFAGSDPTYGNKFNKLSASISDSITIEMYQLDVNQARVLQMISGSPYVGIHYKNTPYDSIEMMVVNSVSIPNTSMTEKVDAKLTLTPLSVQELVF